MADDLRPRPLGALFARAFAILRRGATPLALLLALAAVPAALVAFAATPGDRRADALFAQFIAALLAGRAADAARLQDQLAHLERSPAPLLGVLVALTLWPLARTAFFVAFARLAAGAPAGVRGALRIAVARWFAQLAVGAIFAGVLLLGALVWGAAVAVLAVIVALVTLPARAAGAPAMSVVAAVMMALALAAYAVVHLVYDLASVAVATEDADPRRSFGRAVRRVADRASRRRTLAVALLLGAFALGAALASGAADALVAGVLHRTAPALAAAAVAGTAIEALRLGALQLYADEIRTRREGLDLVPAPAGERAAGPLGDDGLSAGERALAERYLARRAALSAPARDALAAQIAAVLRPHLRASFDHLDDDALLEHLGRNARPVAD